MKSKNRSGPSNPGQIEHTEKLIDTLMRTVEVQANAVQALSNMIDVVLKYGYGTGPATPAETEPAPDSEKT
jgi:hypothetical protein